jgi:hypothetical protein
MNKIFTIVAIATTVLFASCKSISDETMTQMTNFETSWKAMSDQMTAWGTTMNAAKTEMETMMADHMATATEESDKMHEDVKAGMAAMEASYKAAMDSVAAGTTQFTAWKDEVVKAKDEEAAVAGLAEWNSKLTGYTTMMADWEPTLNGLKEACMAACMVAETAATDKTGKTTTEKKKMIDAPEKKKN